MRRVRLLFTLLGILGGWAWLSGAGVAQNAGGWGTLKGRIVWGAELPKRTPLNVDKDQKHCLEKGPILTEEWVINEKTKGVRDTFLWLAPKDPDDKSPLPIHPSLKDLKVKEVVVDQPCCAFVPHALGLREGQVLVAKNSSPIPHNFKYDGHPLENPGGNPLIPPGQKVDIAGLRAGRFPILMSCSIHGWMKGYIRVFDHPYYAVTDENGNFELKNAPAGNYRLMIWHGSAGWSGGAAGKNGQPVAIKGGDAVTDLGNLEFKTK